MKIGRYDPYKLGYTCATIFFTIRGNYENKSKSLKKIKYELQIETYLYEVGIVSNRKLVCYGESQYLSSVHTARHIKEVNFN